MKSTIICSILETAALRLKFDREVGGELVVTVTNCHLSEPARVKINIVGNDTGRHDTPVGHCGAGQWEIKSIKNLSSQSVRDHNTVESPDRVCVHSRRNEESSEDMVVTLEPHSVSALVLKK